jgi:hypothetical protein
MWRRVQGLLKLSISTSENLNSQIQRLFSHMPPDFYRLDSASSRTEKKKFDCAQAFELDLCWHRYRRPIFSRNFFQASGHGIKSANWRGQGGPSAGETKMMRDIYNRILGVRGAAIYLETPFC